METRNDLKIFEKYDITAGFTKKPDNSIDRRNEMIEWAEDPTNSDINHVIRGCLVHGKNVVTVDEAFLENQPAFIEVPDCDGLVTDIPKVCISTTHGDCIPVYAYDPVKRAIGVAHAGWKGTKLGIAEELIHALEKSYGSRPEDIVAFIGPGIDKCHFEVSDDVKEEFLSYIPWSEEYIVPKDIPGKYLIDLKGINRRYLENAGVVSIEVSPDCTYCMETQYYSYRRIKDSKRMLAYMML